jgi:hypothetical protein
MSNLLRRHIISFLTIALLLTFWTTTSNAITVNIDQYSITRDGIPFFTDNFSDGLEPPSAPSFLFNPTISTSYFTLGTFPSTAESGGLLQLNTATGAFSANAIETPRRLTFMMVKIPNPEKWHVQRSF